MNRFVWVVGFTGYESNDLTFPVEQVVIIVVRDEELRELVFAENPHALGD